MKKILLGLAISLFIGSSVSAAEFNSNLKYGSKGAEVKKLQEFLVEQELYSGPITGNFFSLTLKAVKDFQRRELITPVSGFFGALTRAKVNEMLDNQLVESGTEEMADPVIVEAAPVSAEVLRLNELLGAVQNQTVATNQQLGVLQEQNQILQNTLALQQAEADRLKALADAEAARLAAIEQARVEAENLARQQAEAEARKPLYTPQELRDKFRNLLDIYSTAMVFMFPGVTYSENYTFGETYHFDVIFGKKGTQTDWGNARVVFNGQTILNKDGASSITIRDLPAIRHSYQIIYPSPGREDSVYEGTFTPPNNLQSSHLNLL